MKKIVRSGMFLSMFCLLLLCNTFTVSAKDKKQVIVAHVTVKSEYKEVMTKAFEEVIKDTRKEPGNISYHLYEHADNPLKFTFIEEWKSQEAIDAHNNSTHFRKFAKTVEGKAALEVYVMEKKF